MLRNISMSKRIYALVVLMLLSFIIIAGALRWGIGRITDIGVSSAQEVMYDDQKDKLRVSVHSMAEALGRLVRDEPSAERRKGLIRKSIATIRFEEDRSGYYFVYDFWGVNVAHPFKPEFQGTNRLDVRDPEGKAYISELKEAAKGGGYVEYTFDKPGKGKVKKLAYAEVIPGTDYWIATGFYLDNIAERKAAIEKRIQSVSRTVSLTLTITIAAFIGLIVIPVTRSIIRSILGPLASVSNAVRTISRGELHVTVDSSGNDELSLLGRSFNDMAANLLAARESLTVYQEQLEDQVRQRTEELSESLDKLETANRQVLESIHYARTIQQAILPPSALISEHLQDYFVIWDPKDIIGGDLYWFKGGDDCFLIGVIDCTGHGVPGAIMTMIAGTALGRVVNDLGPCDPGRILAEMNRIVRMTLSQNMDQAESDDGLDMGLCLVRKNGDMVFAGARISLFVLGNDEIREVKGDRFSIGYKSSNHDFSFTNHEVCAKEGTCFYMTTDGLRDQVGGDSGLPFGKTRLLNLLQSVRHLPLAGQKEAVLRSFEEYRCGEMRRDDITLFGFRL